MRTFLGRHADQLTQESRHLTGESQIGLPGSVREAITATPAVETSEICE